MCRPVIGNANLALSLIITMCHSLCKYEHWFVIFNVNFAFAQGGAEDLRIKLEADYSPQPPTSNTTPSTPTSLVSYMENKDGSLPTSLASIAPADMLNVWNATKLSSKSGTVNTADGKQWTILFFKRRFATFETAKWINSNIIHWKSELIQL